jgi:hypothetical protein
MTSCKPGTAAYGSTILDLAARGYLGVSKHPTGLWLTYNEVAAGYTPLGGYEQRVLDAMHGRLKSTGGAPFTVLAEACKVDVSGTWTPFEESLRKEAKRRGICRGMIPMTAATASVAAVTTAAVATFTALIVVSRAHSSHGAAIGAGIAAAVIFPLVLAGIGYRDRLTPLGAGLAARWARARQELAANPAVWGFGAEGSTPDENQLMYQRRAFAAALDIPGAGGGPIAAGHTLPGKVRGGAPSETRMPTEAWSSFTGDWRLVKIKKTARAGMGRGIGMLIVAAWLGFIAWVLTIPSGTEPFPLVIGAVAILIGVNGAAAVAKVAAIPTRATFDAQVIARWYETESSDEGSSSTIPWFAADSGTQAWTFSGDPAERVGLEDVVRLTINPRTAGLIDMTVLRQQRPQTPIPDEFSTPMTALPAEPLLSTVEAATMIGPVSRTTAIPAPGGHGTLYRGSEGSLSLIVVGGGVAKFNTMISSKVGKPLGGVGDAAWLLAKDRTVVVRLGDQVAKITASGAGVERRPDLLANLAATVATRMSQQPTLS